MIIYPKHKFRPFYVGEAKVYDLLAKLPDARGFAVHSVNLPEHEYKRWSEADFVIVNQTGITLLEIKGGVVSLAGKEWRYENARGQAIFSTEGPAKQALSAAIALERLLYKHLGRKVRCRWGVCFPLSRFTKRIAELPETRLADIHTCLDVSIFHKWLRNIPFDQYKAEDFALTLDEVKAIQEIIIPELNATVSLGLAVCSVQKQAIQLTEQQFSILESLESNPRLCISGGAGTGKTELAALTARAERAAGRYPAIVTMGKALSVALKTRMAAFGIPVVSHTLPFGTDTLIVDEGQDFATRSQFKELFSQLPGGIEAGRWRWFMDPNLQFMDIPPDPECLGTIAHNAVAVTLTRNVRSTSEIVSTIRNLLNADIGITQIDGFGIKVCFHRAANIDEETDLVQKLINEMLDDGINPSEIAVLGPSGCQGAVCSKLVGLMRGVLQELSLDGNIQSTSQGVICGINDFRGLEARVVILTDLDELCQDKTALPKLYIGMSRATASLHMLVLPTFGAFLKQLVKNSIDRDLSS